MLAPTTSMMLAHLQQKPKVRIEMNMSQMRESRALMRRRLVCTPDARDGRIPGACTAPGPTCTPPGPA